MVPSWEFGSTDAPHRAVTRRLQSPSPGLRLAVAKFSSVPDLHNKGVVGGPAADRFRARDHRGTTSANE